MEFLVLLFGVALVVTVLVMFVKWLFSPRRQKPKAGDPYSLSTKDSDLSYYNQANAIFSQLQKLRDQPQEFTAGLFQVIHLCQMEINHATNGAKNGDALVLLANAYFLVAMVFNQTKVYDHCIVRSLAVIKRWNDVPVHTRNHRNGQQLYAGIKEHVKQVQGGLTPQTQQVISSILRGTDQVTFSKAIALDDIENINKLLNRHTALESALEATSEDNPQKAIAICTQMLQRQPDDAMALYIRASAYQQCKLYEKAIADLNKAIELERDARFYGTRALIYLTMQRNDEALRDSNQAIKLQPDVAAYHSSRGFALLNLGRREEAIQAFNNFYNSPDANSDDGRTARQILMTLKLSDKAFNERLAQSLKELSAQKDAGILTDEEFKTKSLELIETMFLD